MALFNLINTKLSSSKKLRKQQVINLFDKRIKDSDKSIVNNYFNYALIKLDNDYCEDEDFQLCDLVKIENLLWVSTAATDKCMTDELFYLKNASADQIVAERYADTDRPFFVNLSNALKANEFAVIKFNTEFKKAHSEAIFQNYYNCAPDSSLLKQIRPDVFPRTIRLFKRDEEQQVFNFTNYQIKNKSSLILTSVSNTN